MKMGLAMAVFLLLGESGFACQVSCIEYHTETSRARLLLNHDEPIHGASIIIRDASSRALGPAAECAARKGPIVLETQTDKRGEFSLGGLLPGRYWITYLHPELGESFLLVFEPPRDLNEKTLDLRVDDFSGRCYLFDIERNASKPRGAIVPVKTDRNDLPMGDALTCRTVEFHGDDGMPLEGALVQIRRLEKSWPHRGLSVVELRLGKKVAKGRTDTAGRWRIKSLPPATYAVQISTPKEEAFGWVVVDPEASLRGDCSQTFVAKKVDGALILRGSTN